MYGRSVSRSYDSESFELLEDRVDAAWHESSASHIHDATAILLWYLSLFTAKGLDSVDRRRTERATEQSDDIKTTS